MRESLIEGRLVNKAKFRPDTEIRKAKWLDRNGAPDRVLMSQGLTIFVECKATGKVPNSIQLREHKRLRDAGQIVVVVDSFESVDAIFATLDQLKDFEGINIFGFGNMHNIFTSFYLACGLGLVRSPWEQTQLDEAREQADKAYRKARDLV